MHSSAKADKKESARVDAAALDEAQFFAVDDVSSAAIATLPAEPVAADVHDVSPRASDDNSFPVELIYSGESDGGSVSKETPR
uniref:Uncharacterized protein n=1 Tax=Peronospora matthiolae TaxID=2874970 RepID=A0AAV1UYU6_9STRA